MLPIEQKKIKVDNYGVTILDPELKKNITRKNLSPSLVNGIIASPGNWVLSNYIGPLVQIEEPIYFARGKWFHSILETLFKNGIGESLSESLKAATMEVTQENDCYKDLLQDPENKDWINRCLRGFLSLEEDHKFTEWTVATMPLGKYPKEGIEFFARTKFDWLKTTFLGFIDLLVEKEDGLQIVDWKTGKMKAGNPEYRLQQTSYAMALEDLGYKVSSACLIFPIGREDRGTTEWIDIHSDEVRQETKERILEGDKILTNCKETFFFPWKREKSVYTLDWQYYFIGYGRGYPLKVHHDKLLAISDIEGLS